MLTHISFGSLHMHTNERFFMQHTGLKLNVEVYVLNGNLMVSSSIFVPHCPKVCQLYSLTHCLKEEKKLNNVRSNGPPSVKRNVNQTLRGRRWCSCTIFFFSINKLVVFSLQAHVCSFIWTEHHANAFVVSLLLNIQLSAPISLYNLKALYIYQKSFLCLGLNFSSFVALVYFLVQNKSYFYAIE